MALLMVMGLSLLIYALAEHQLRQQLVAQEQTIPDQKGRVKNGGICPQIIGLKCPLIPV